MEVNGRQIIERVYLWSIFFTGALSFFWMWGKNASLIIVLISGFFLINREIFNKIIVHSWFVRSSLLMFLVILAGVFYGPETFSRTFSVLTKYRRLLFPLILIPAFVFFPRSKTFFLYGATLSGLVLFPASAVGFFYNPPMLGKIMTINPIYIAFISNLCALFAFFLFQKEKKKIYLWIFILFSFYLSFISLQKACFCVYSLWVSGLLVWLGYHRKWKWVLLGIIYISASLSFQFLVPFSPLNHRLGFDPSDHRLGFNSFKMNESKKETYMSATRLKLINDSLQLMKEKPFLGWGTGGIDPAFKSHKKTYSIAFIVNPHNQFLLIAVELGLLGFFVLLLWVYAICKDICISEWKYSNILVICFMLLLISSFCADCLLLINISGDFLIIIVSLLIAECYREKDKGTGCFCASK